jgi:hypothetical protein
VTSFAASATGAGITLVGEIVDLDSRNGSDLSSMSVRWLSVTVDPTGASRAVRSDADSAGASFIPPQRSGDDDPRRPDRPDQDRRPGRRGLTGSIRRLIDGPQGRHRRTH